MRFQRALAKGHLWLAEDAALRLLLHYRDEPAKYERTAARWISRYAAEAPRVTYCPYVAGSDAARSPEDAVAQPLPSHPLGYGDHRDHGWA
jgi:hypothetical protein